MHKESQSQHGKQRSWQRMKFVLLTLLLLESGGVIIASEVEPTIRWDVAGPPQRIGPTYPHQPPFTYVIAPKAVVQAAQKELGGNLSAWKVIRVWDYYLDRSIPYTTRHEVVWLRNGDKGFICLVQHDCWKRLDALPKSLPYVTELLGESIHLPPTSKDEGMAGQLISDVANLLQAHGCQVVNKEALEEESQSELSFTKEPGHPDRNPAKFRALCVDPTLDSKGNGVWIFTGNVVTNQGEGQRWTVTVKFGKKLEITSINRQELYRPGTFMWNLF